MDMGASANQRYLREQFAEGVEGQRAVQYFDKSRMEINDPTADPNATWYVTNGLLPIELMTGSLQTGYNQFEQRGAGQDRGDRRPGTVPDLRRPAARCTRAPARSTPATWASRPP